MNHSILKAGLAERGLATTTEAIQSPAATSNSSICGQVKFPQ